MPTEDKHATKRAARKVLPNSVRAAEGASNKSKKRSYLSKAVRQKRRAADLIYLVYGLYRICQYWALCPCVLHALVSVPHFG